MKILQLRKALVLINTYLNIRGNPIVCTLRLAFAYYIRTNKDLLIIKNFVLEKEKQKEEFH